MPCTFSEWTTGTPRELLRAIQGRRGDPPAPVAIDSDKFPNLIWLHKGNILDELKSLDPNHRVAWSVKTNPEARWYSRRVVIIKV